MLDPDPGAKSRAQHGLAQSGNGRTVSSSASVIANTGRPVPPPPASDTPPPVPAQPAPTIGSDQVAGPAELPSSPGSGVINVGVRAAPRWKQEPQAAAAAASRSTPSVRAWLTRRRSLDSDVPERKDDLTEKAITMAPPWMVSLVLHMLVLVLLGLLYLPGVLNDSLELKLFASQPGEQLEEQNLVTFEIPETTQPELSLEEFSAEDPLAAPMELELALPVGGTIMTDEIEAPSIGLALSGREKGKKEALLAAYGGTAETEEAVKMGLEWLKRQQRSDGSWSLNGPYSNGCFNENKTAATAMALLAFQGAGHTHLSGDYQKEVQRGWNAMLRMQDRDGNFFQGGPHHHRLYSQGQATIAICELYGMTKDSKFRHPAQLAVNYAVRVQAPAGGWRYWPGQDTDTSVTGWFMMGLQSAMMAELEVSRPALYKISDYLDTASTDGIAYSYLPGDEPSWAMTAEALLCRQYLGWKRDDRRLQEGIQYLLDKPIDWDDPDVYYWYYATQVLHHMGGKDWQQWNRVMSNVLPKNQILTGKEKGSWYPEDDAWGTHAGRLYTTCLCIYMLEVYYRHLPIYTYRVQ